MSQINTLYEIAAEIETLMYQADMYAAEHEGEIPDDVAEKLDSLEMQKDEKIGNIARLIKNLKAEADMVDAEAKALAQRKKSTQNKAEWLKRYLAAFLGEGQKYQDATVKIGWRKSVSTVIDNADTIEDKYCKIERKPVLSAIKEAINSGENIIGARLEEKQSLQIK